MTNFARIIDNVAVDVSVDPENEFHPTITAEFVSVPDDVKPQWRLVNGLWTAPPPVPFPTPVQVYPQVSPVQFQLLFTSPERVAIKAARPNDPVIEDFYSLVEDPRLTYVDLGLKSTQEALDHLVAVSLITEVRKAEILTGVLQ